MNPIIVIVEMSHKDQQSIITVAAMVPGQIGLLLDLGSGIHKMHDAFT